MHDKVSSMIRKTATKTLSVLLGCCKDQSQMKALLNLYLPGFAKQIKMRLDSTDFRSVKWLVCELSRCFKHFYSWPSNHPLLPIIDPNMVSELCQLLAQVLQTVALDKTTRLE